MRYLFLLITIFAFVFSGCSCNEKIQDSTEKELSSEESFETQEQKSSQVNESKQVDLPLENAEKRIIKKPFGIYITPNNSPISPERFSGYHTGIDYEIFENETNSKVNVYAIRAGKILQKKNVSGYGGVVIQKSELDGQTITILYGHLDLSSIKQKVGDSLKKGEEFAVLGDAFSTETDGERKHLHLGIHKGSEINLKGYVGSESELKDWIDFSNYS